MRLRRSRGALRTVGHRRDLRIHGVVGNVEGEEHGVWPALGQALQGHHEPAVLHVSGGPHAGDLAVRAQRHEAAHGDVRLVALGAHRAHGLAQETIGTEEALRALHVGLHLEVIAVRGGSDDPGAEGDRKSTRLNSSHVAISYAVFCLKKKKKKKKKTNKNKKNKKNKKTTQNNNKN